MFPFIVEKNMSKEDLSNLEARLAASESTLRDIQINGWKVDTSCYYKQEKTEVLLSEESYGAGLAGLFLFIILTAASSALLDNPKEKSNGQHEAPHCTR